MPYFGCHLSPSGGYAAMVRTAASLGGDTFQFFTRNPRGSRPRRRIWRMPPGPEPS